MEEFCGKMVCCCGVVVVGPLFRSSASGTGRDNGRGEVVCWVGNWLTFVRNRGELAEGWYDPATKRRADEATPPVVAGAEEDGEEGGRGTRDSPSYDPLPESRAREEDAEEESDEGSVGPALPGQSRGAGGSGGYAGPTIPSLSDLELQRGTWLSSLDQGHDALMAF